MGAVNSSQPPSSDPGTVSPYGSLLLVSVIVWAIVVGAYVLGPSPVLDGTLTAVDDYMRMVQVYDWLDGAGWYDVRQDRLDPPEGINMHWSRFADLPLAAVIAVAEPWVGRETATIAAAIVVPALLMLALLLAVGWMAAPLLDRDQVPLAALMTILTIPLLIQFFPGRVDHHAWQLLIATLSVGALVRLMRQPEARGPAVLAGAVMALGLWIGLGALPWAALFMAVLVLRWIVVGRRVASAGLTTAAVLSAGTLILLPIARPPGVWLDRACDGFSITYVGLAALGVVFWGVLWVGSRRVVSVRGRLGIAAAAAALALVVLAVLFPECLALPIISANQDPLLATAWWANVGEDRSILTLFQSSPAQTPFWLLGPVVAVVVAAFQVFGRGGWTRWGAYLAFAAVAVALPLWHSRLLPFAHLFAVAPLAWLLGVPWQRVADWSMPSRVAARFALLIAFSPVPTGAVILLAQDPSTPDARQSVRSACDIRRAVPVLNGARFSERPRIIAAFIDLGPELLFRTRHVVLAAPYHRNVAGKVDVLRLFAADTDEAARRIVRRRKVDLIFFCPLSGDRYVYQGDSERAFVDRLADGEIPAWLSPVPLPGESKLLLFEVRPGG